MGWLRHPRTTAEKKENGKRCNNGIDYGGFLICIRAKRSAKMLPDAWDDIINQSCRSWKKHRKTQWKHKP